MSRITEMPAAAALDGTELVETVQGGANVQTTTQDIADLAPPPSTTLDSLTDVDTSTTPPTDQQALMFDDASGLWLPGDVAAGGGGGGGSAPFAGARLVGAATTLVAGAQTTLNWNTTPIFDTDGFFNPATPTRLTVPAGMAGYYEATALGSITGLAPDKRWLLIIGNSGGTGGGLIDLTSGGTTSFDVRGIATTGPIYLDAGDYIDVSMYQFDSVNRDTIHADNFFTLRKIEPATSDGAFDGAILTHSTTQSIPSTAFTALTFDTEEVDSDGYHDTATNPTRITAPADGEYHISAGATVAIGATTTHRYIDIYKNGTTRLAIMSAPAWNDAGFEAALNVSLTCQLVAGDYIEIRVFQDTGGALNALTARAEIFRVSSGGSGEGGDLVEIESQIVTVAGSVTFSNIPATYRDLVLKGKARGDRAAINDYIIMRVGNGAVDSGANYRNAVAVSNSLSLDHSQASRTDAVLGRVVAATATADVWSPVTIEIFDYIDTTYWRSISAMTEVHEADATFYKFDSNNHWKNKADIIDTLQLLALNGNFIVGTRFTLYGRGTA